MTPLHVAATGLLALLLGVPVFAGASSGSARDGGSAGAHSADSRPASAMAYEAPPDTTTTVGVPVVLGRLDPEKIDLVVEERLREIRYCYQRRLVERPGLAGEVRVVFVIEPDGTVSSASTEASTMNDPAVESCINERFMRMKFPKPRRGEVVVVTLPFTFVPG